jgi:hypothetical protein
MPKELNMGPEPDGWVHPSVGIAMEPALTDFGEEWLVALRVGPPFLVDLSANNWLLAALLSNMPEEIRESVILRTCLGGRTPQAT